MAKTGAVFGWLDSNLIVIAGALFCRGLVLSHNLVDYACTSVTMVFYTGNQKTEHMAVAAILVSLQEGLTSISAILLARIKDVHKGRFYAIFLSTSSYISGDLMGDLKINHKIVRFSLFIVIKTFISHITILAFWLCGAKKQQVMLTRIGAGMICAVIICIIAWKVELERQSDARLSMLWMCPQFVLLGLVEGLAQSRLEKLFENVSLRNLWGKSKEVVSCFGNFLNIPCILIFRSWFRKDHSHLDRYYIMLAVLSSLFLCIYVVVAIAYEKRTPENMEENRGTIEENGSA
ncbi:hypothetical protein L6164_002229 [Bauhinia variegata]|uniref:Uncharacterized protein n=1 Tax=Bauhinia variegata TaxID=167791 RepID=A0ACB9Q099_BAUVA|nr:hypothetical protein L6164_002229 [Bauhinia variegata]